MGILDTFFSRRMEKEIPEESAHEKVSDAVVEEIAINSGNQNPETERSIKKTTNVKINEGIESSTKIKEVLKSPTLVADQKVNNVKKKKKKKSSTKNEVKTHDIGKTITLEDLTNPNQK